MRSVGAYCNVSWPLVRWRCTPLTLYPKFCGTE